MPSVRNLGGGELPVALAEVPTGVGAEVTPAWFGGAVVIAFEGIVAGAAAELTGARTAASGSQPGGLLPKAVAITESEIATGAANELSDTCVCLRDEASCN